MPWLMNGPLVVLAIGAIAAGFVCHHWIEEMVNGSSAQIIAADAEHGTHEGMDLHTIMMIVSSVIALSGIALAWFLHLHKRDVADRIAKSNAQVVRLLENKYYIDEIYHALVVRPLRGLGYAFFVIDQLIIDGLVLLVGTLPKLVGLSFQPTQRGVLQGYGVGMLAGIVLLVLILLFAM